MVKEILLVALPLETEGKTEPHITTIYTGVGKVNASIRATQAIVEHQPDRIINYGTAGSHIYNKGELIDCTSFVQRDMHIASLGFQQYETPFDSETPITLEFKHIENRIGTHSTCYSGDSFLQDNSFEYQVIDMEAYGIAKACYLTGVEFIAYKYITDGADESSGDDWEENASKGVDQFVKLMWGKM